MKFLTLSDKILKTAFSKNILDNTTQYLSNFRLDQFHTLTEIYHWLKYYVEPTFDEVTISVIGKTAEDRDIFAVQIGYDYNPTISVDCGIHAREWASHAFCIFLINELLDGNEKIWTNDIYWIIYPVLNPDGYAFSWKRDRQQSSPTPAHLIF